MRRLSTENLRDRLRHLDEVGLVARDPSVATRLAPYCLTPAGEQLVPTLMSLWEWAKHWVPEDPAAAQRDPAVILWWLRHRIVVDATPERQVAIEFAIDGDGEAVRTWLLVARDSEPELCLEDPELSAERYVLRRGRCRRPGSRRPRPASWADAVTAGSVRLYGEPRRVAALPDWFPRRDTDAAPTHRSRGQATAAA